MTIENLPSAPGALTFPLCPFCLCSGTPFTEPKTTAQLLSGTLQPLSAAIQPQCTPGTATLEDQNKNRAPNVRDVKKYSRHWGLLFRAFPVHGQSDGSPSLRG